MDYALSDQAVIFACPKSPAEESQGVTSMFLGERKTKFYLHPLPLHHT